MSTLKCGFTVFNWKRDKNLNSRDRFPLLFCFTVYFTKKCASVEDMLTFHHSLVGAGSLFIVSTSRKGRINKMNELLFLLKMEIPSEILMQKYRSHGQIEKGISGSRKPFTTDGPCKCGSFHVEEGQRRVCPPTKTNRLPEKSV